MAAARKTAEKSNGETTGVAAPTTQVVFTAKWLDKLLNVVLYGRGYQAGFRICFPEPREPKDAKPRFEHRWAELLEDAGPTELKRVRDVEIVLLWESENRVTVKMVGRGYEMKVMVEYFEVIGPLINELVTTETKAGADTAMLAAVGTKPAVALPSSSNPTSPSSKPVTKKKKPWYKLW